MSQLTEVKEKVTLSVQISNYMVTHVYFYLKKTTRAVLEITL